MPSDFRLAVPRGLGSVAKLELSWAKDSQNHRHLHLVQHSHLHLLACRHRLHSWGLRLLALDYLLVELMERRPETAAQGRWFSHLPSRLMVFHL
jgi:hypothetical protein